MHMYVHMGGIHACMYLRMLAIHGSRVPFYVPRIVWHPDKQDPKRDPYLDNYPHPLWLPSLVGGFCLRSAASAPKIKTAWGVQGL